MRTPAEEQPGQALAAQAAGPLRCCPGKRMKTLCEPGCSVRKGLTAAHSRLWSRARLDGWPGKRFEKSPSREYRNADPEKNPEPGDRARRNNPLCRVQVPAPARQLKRECGSGIRRFPGRAGTIMLDQQQGGGHPYGCRIRCGA